MIKRIFGGAIVLGLLFTSTAHAASLDDVLKKLTILQNEVSSLKSQLGAFAHGSFGATSVSSASSSDASFVSTPSITSTIPVPPSTKTVPNPNLMNSLNDNLKVTAITSTNGQPSVTVLSPNGGETYKEGDEVKFRWKTTGVSKTVNTLVAIMDERTPGWQTRSEFGGDNPLKYAKLISSNNNENIYEYTFKVPASFDATLPSQYKGIYGGNHYKMLVSIWYAGDLGTSSAKIIEDYSDNNFAFNKDLDETISSIKLLSPNAGGSFQIGKTMSITWKTSGIPATHEVHALVANQDTNSTSRAIISLGQNDGSSVITIPTTTDPDSGHDALVPGTYKLKLTTLSPDKKYDIQDEADKLITLTGASFLPVAGIVGCDAAKAKGYAIGVTALLIPPQTVSSNSKNVLVGKYKIENCPGTTYQPYLVNSSMNLVKKDAKGELINLPSNPLSSVSITLTGKNEGNQTLVKNFKSKMRSGGGFRGTAQYTIIETDFTGNDFFKDFMPIGDGGVIMEVYANMKNVNQSNLSLELNNVAHSRPSYYGDNSSYSSGPFSISVKTTSTIDTKKHQ